MDYDTELADHREAYAALAKRDDVDPRRIVILGAFPLRQGTTGAGERLSYVRSHKNRPKEDE